MSPALLADTTASNTGAANAVDDQAITLDNTMVTAEKELKQAPGVSIITADDIQKAPPVNDLSDIIR
ncbi:hypothetical protein, partial [Pseudomonas sp.]|uniref:hypothetical protein n=1 Tax=Pseudomonas sp. TaxID=306 RepID=UPI00258D5DAB